jgi:glyoxylase-like metal-dependent hydrolase (beta-lactamase superfamily II)
MNKAASGAAALFILLAASTPALRPAPAGFQKVSPHFFCFASGIEAPNTGAVITADGILLIDPPPEAENAALLKALKVLSSRPVRWVVNTDYQKAAEGGWAPFLKQGAAVIFSKELDRLAGAAPAAETAAAGMPNPRLLFGRQLHLWPANIEVRLLAVKSRARTAGDVIAFLPSEKVLATGDFFVPSGFPLIVGDAGEGSARGWIEGLKQVIDFVPLLKSAMPQPRQEPSASAEPPKTLEETILVVPGHGPASNLQQMKILLAAAQRLQFEASRAAAIGRAREDFVSSLPPDIYGAFANLEDFAGRLFDDVKRK